MLLMASVSFCRADSSPPTKEPKTEIVATLINELNTTVFTKVQLVEKNQDAITTNDAKIFTLNGVWNLPAEKATYVVVGQVSVPSWLRDNKLFLCDETIKNNYTTTGTIPFIYQKGIQTFYIHGAV